MPLRRFSAAELVSYVPDFAIAGTFLITWLAPLTFGPKMIGYLLTVVLLELFVVIAAALIAYILVEDLAWAPPGRGVKPDTIKITVGLAVFIWLFPALYGSLEGIWWMLWAYWLLLLNRLSGLCGTGPRAGRRGCS